MAEHDDMDALRVSEERFRRLIEGAPDGVVICRDAIVLYANPAALQLLGYRKADLVGRSMSIFLDEASMGAMRRRIQQMAETGERLTPREYPARRRDGTIATVEISSIFIEYEGAPAVLAFARDVTDRSRLRSQLEHADRLAALGRLAAGVAHEINNPLAFMTLAASSLSKRLVNIAADEEIHALAEDIQLGVMRIAAVARDLRIYGRYEDETATAVDLGRVLEQSMRLTAHELIPRVRVELERGPLPPVRGVATRLEQVFVNLLLNAGHAIDEERTDGAITVVARAREDSVVVEVQDNGAGIPDDAVERLFEPFFTTRAPGAGTGLGLSICRDILTRFGGSLVATSEPGQGTIMRVTLARATSEEIAESQPRPDHMAVRTSARRRILVIEDEPLVAAMVSDTLGEAHEVVVETDAQSGLTRLLRDGSFDLVLCDLMMPRLTGMDIYEQIAVERPGLELRFAFFTGGAYTQRARAFLDAVGNARLMKPFSSSELEMLVETTARRTAE